MNFRFDMYAFFVGLSVAVAYFVFLKLDQNKNSRVYFLLNIFVGFVGAKFFLFLNTILFSNTKIDWYSWKAWIWSGGVIYGAVMSTYVINFFLLWMKAIPCEKFSAFMIVFTLMQSMGRQACYFAGCCYGSVSFSQKIISVQQVESFFLLFLFIILAYLWKMKMASRSIIFIIYIPVYAIMRFILEFFREDNERGILENGLSFSQVLSVIFFLVGVLVSTFFMVNSKNVKREEMLR